MIDDKFFVRNGGPIDSLTHQPSSGKSSGGGLRAGEMELSSITAHGLSATLNELIYDKSDGIETYICKKCGKICVFNEENNKFFCKFCKNLIEFAKVKLGYASKLLIYELYSMGIAVRLNVE
jgi:DNA-directed RNA polymerase beta subunit